jgi:hypothetical protein
VKQSVGKLEIGMRWVWQRGLPVELLVGIGLSIVLALIVVLAGGAMTTEAPTSPARTIIVPSFQEQTEDLDPRDPLVMCTVFVDHTKCAREET